MKEIENAFAQSFDAISSSPDGDYFDILSSSGHDLKSLESIDIEGLTFVGKQFKDASLSHSDLTDTHFIGCDFDHCEFNDTKLYGAHFTLCTFSQTTFDTPHTKKMKFTASSLVDTLFISKHIKVSTNNTMGLLAFAKPAEIDFSDLSPSKSSQHNLLRATHRVISPRQRTNKFTFRDQPSLNQARRNISESLGKEVADIVFGYAAKNQSSNKDAIQAIARSNRPFASIGEYYIITDPQGIRQATYPLSNIAGEIETLLQGLIPARESIWVSIGEDGTLTFKPEKPDSKDRSGTKTHQP